ncbi:hypothetical protein Y968_18615 [Klebsiella pneumoniae UHKPC05]|nr:hypothetical protein Y968_18615 [Klebsiella pneumoniae UHKPC05]KEG33655.1 hypothetical protein EQ82_13845 [Klebsiella pneumoniae]
MRLLLPDGKVNQQPGGDMDVIHDPQRAGIHLGGAIVPHKVTQPGSHHAEPHQHAPLQRGGRQLLGVAEHKPRRHRHDKGPDIEPGKGIVLRHRTHLHQTLIPHHTDGEAEV